MVRRLSQRTSLKGLVDGARAIIISLAPGEELGDHQVRERAWLTVVEGTARIEAGGQVVEAGPAEALEQVNHLVQTPLA